MAAQLSKIISAVVSLALVALAFLQYRDSSMARQTADLAQRKAIVNERIAESASKTAEGAKAKLATLVDEAQRTSKRLGSVENVLTLVDVPSGGRKVCVVSEREGLHITGVSLYVPAAWSVDACMKVARTQLRGQRVRVGCVFKNSASFAEATPFGPRPEPNCGW